MPNVLDGITTNETYRLTWVEDIADPNAMSLATELNASTSVPLECLTVEAMDPDVSVETSSLRRACTNKVRQVSGQETRTIADLIVVLDPQDMEADVSKAYATLARGAVGYLVQRAGIQVDTGTQAGDLCDVYKVRIKYRIKIQGADNDEWKAKVGVDVLDWWEDVPVAA